MAVTEADIRKIADLARLSIADVDVPVMAAQLNSILSHMDVLGRVDTSAIDGIAVASASATSTITGAPLRGDAVSPIPMNATAPMLAPESEDGFILVPRLTTHEEL